MVRLEAVGSRGGNRVVITVPAALEGERIDRAVSILLDLPRAEAGQLVDGGSVQVGGQPVRSRSHRVHEGNVLEVTLVAAVPPVGPVADPDVPVEVVHHDVDVVVVDKPAGLVVHPGAGRTGGTLVNGLLARFPEIAGVGDPGRPGIVHRLDVGTSGLLAVARSERGYQSLVAQLGARTVERRYRALLWGHLSAPSGVVDAPVGRSATNPTQMAVSTSGKPARTHYQVQALLLDPEMTLVACRLETGRTHQIRVHFAALGHPVVGDDRYGGVRANLVLERPFLHAARLGFDHPGTGEHLRFESPLPAELEALLIGRRTGQHVITTTIVTEESW